MWQDQVQWGVILDCVEWALLPAAFDLDLAFRSRQRLHARATVEERRFSGLPRAMP
jgi:hypothetical protein